MPERRIAKIPDIFRQPYPRINEAAGQLRTCILFGCFVSLFLFVFRPFGLHRMDPSRVATIAGWFGIVCIVCLLVTLLLIPQSLPSVFRESGWTVWKEIIQNLVCTGAVCVGNVLFSHWYFGDPLNQGMMWDFALMTLAVGIFPVTGLVLFKQMRLMRSYSRRAAELDGRLVLEHLGGKGGGISGEQAGEISGELVGETGKQEGKAQTKEKRVVKFTGEGKESVRVPLEEFLYAEAADNYVKLYYLKEGRLSQSMIRSTLRKVEEECRTLPCLYRCHRGYLVNLGKVVHIKGNAQGYKLELEGALAGIPVSRNLNKEIMGLVIGPKCLATGHSDLP